MTNTPQEPNGPFWAIILLVLSMGLIAFAIPALFWFFCHYIEWLGKEWPL